MEKYVIIVAGGKGIRMSDALPKQFMEINGRPLLMHTFDAFSDISQLHFILVLHRNYLNYWQQLCQTYQFTTTHQVVEGGPKRFHSVKSGLNLIPGSVLVAVHDGVRPLVSKKMINTGFEIALRKGNAVPAVAINESVREVSGSLSKSVDRNRFKMIQTPQFFQSAILKKAYRQTYDESFTDDAMVLEAAGQQIYLFEGDRRNVKITTPEDLAYAGYLLQERGDMSTIDK